VGPRVYRGVTGEVVGTALMSEQVGAPSNVRLADLFDAHQGRLYRLARRLATTPEEARDLVQETFLRVVKAPKSVPSGLAAQEAWLVRILVNLSRDQWRRRSSRGRLDALHQAESWTLASGNPESAVIAQATVWRALQMLAPRRRATIVLHELEGVGIAQIARLLGVSLVTVRWHLARGRRELARAITNHEEGRS
jgi:RNA polymerase sigma-70 factor (ECF subfamily)